MQNVGKTLRNIYGTRNLINNFKSSVNQDEPTVIEECYIIYIKTLGKQLFCKNCGSILSLLDCVKERWFGLTSVFYIKFHSCKIITDVYIDKQHTYIGISWQSCAGHYALPHAIINRGYCAWTT